MSKYKWVHTQTDLGCNFEVLQKNFTRSPWIQPTQESFCWPGEGVDNQKRTYILNERLRLKPVNGLPLLRWWLASWEKILMIYGD
jgi:hypothetical protein